MCSCIASLLRRKDLPSQASVNVFPAGKRASPETPQGRFGRTSFGRTFATKRGTLQEHTVFEADEEAQAAPRGKLPSRAQWLKKSTISRHPVKASADAEAFLWIPEKSLIKQLKSLINRKKSPINHQKSPINSQNKKCIC